MRWLIVLGCVLALGACGGGEENLPERAPPAVTKQPVKPPETTDDDRREARRLFDEAEKYSRDRNNSKAAELLMRAIELAPDDAEIHARLGHVYIKLLRYDDARDALVRAIGLVDAERQRELKFLASWCSRKLARAHYDAGNYMEALAEVERALDLQADNIEAHMLLGYVHRALGNHGLAARAFGTAADLAVDSQRYEAMTNVGESQIHAGEHRAAIDTFTELINLGATGYESYGWRAYCYVQVGDRARAIRDFGEAIERTDNPEKRAEYCDALRQLTMLEDEDE